MIAEKTYILVTGDEDILKIFSKWMEEKPFEPNESEKPFFFEDYIQDEESRIYSRIKNNGLRLYKIENCGPDFISSENSIFMKEFKIKWGNILSIQIFGGDEIKIVLKPKTQHKDKELPLGNHNRFLIPYQYQLF